MSWKSALARGLGFVRGNDDRSRDLQAEIRSHIELETDENIERGLDPVEARRAAFLKFGNPQLAQESSQAMWSVPTLESILSDFKYGFRMLKKAPLFSAVAIVTLAAGLGSSIGVFTVANAVLFRRLPYPDLDRIVLMWGGDRKTGDRGQVSFTDTEDIRSRNRVFAAISNYADWTPTLSGQGDPERLAATQVSNGFFDVLGIKPSIGREFTEEENIDGNDNVVILSHNLWTRRFNADPGIIGRTILLNAVPHVVVGIMPEDFETLPSTLVQGGELYRPIGESYDDTQRRAEHLRAIARLKPGFTSAQAEADVERIARELESEHPKEEADIHYSIASLQVDAGHELRPSLTILGWAAAMLLLIACANVAGLLLARSNNRQKEFAMRSALGAPRSRLLRQAFTESLILATLGGAIGIAIAEVAAGMCVLLAPKLGSNLVKVAIDTTSLAFGGCAVLLTSILFGLAPALQSAKANISCAIKQGGQNKEVSRGGQRFQSLIVIGEFVLALTLLTVAALLVQTFVSLQKVDVGFRPERKLLMHVWLPSMKYKKPEQQVQFFDELIRRVSHLPGVKSAALVQNPPLGNFDGRAILPEGQADIPQNLLSPQAYFITPDYLQTMEIPLLQGRGFSAADNESGQLVAIVSQSLANRMFPGQDAVGRKLQLLSDKKIDGKYPSRVIVGVVGDIRHLGPDARVTPGLYVPFRQLPVTWMSLVVDCESPSAIVPSIRGELRTIDRDVAAFKISTYEDLLSDSLLIRKLAMGLISTFGGMALFLAAVGLYGLLSYGVSVRMREFGVRAALGALPADLVKLVLRSGLKLVLLGGLVGIVSSAVAGRFAASVIAGTIPPDVLTITTSFAILAGVAVLASLIPALAAGRANPASTLRTE